MKFKPPSKGQNILVLTHLEGLNTPSFSVLLLRKKGFGSQQAVEQKWPPSSWKVFPSLDVNFKARRCQWPQIRHTAHWMAHHLENIGWQRLEQILRRLWAVGSVDYPLMECGTSTNGQVHCSSDTVPATVYKYEYLTSTPVCIFWIMLATVEMQSKYAHNWQDCVCIEYIS